MFPDDLARSADCVVPDPSQVGWFAARQPGIIGFLEARCQSTEAFAVALDAAMRLCGALELDRGVPPPRLGSAAIERAEQRLVGPENAAALAAREPELLSWIDRVVAAPPLLLAAADRAALGAALLAVGAALDDAGA